MATIASIRPLALVAITTSLVSGHCLITSDLERLQRERMFSHAYLDTWSLDHHKAIGDDPANLGWPDDGNGRYTRSLGYYDWYWLNISKRIYLNDIEHLAYVLPCTIVSAFVHPYISSGLLFTYLIGRTLYRDGYLEREGAFN